MNSSVMTEFQQLHSETLESLHSRYHTMVLRTAYLILADWGHAEDVAQEVWMRVNRALMRFDPDRGAWSTWLHHITVNCCLSTRKRLSRWLGEQLRPETEQPQATTLDNLLRSEEEQVIWNAIGNLSLKLRSVIVLRYFHDLSYEQIAAILECPIGTVRSRLHTAHAQLRNHLEDV
ncbi:sigma-70 family RNA polymerase sigma factor [Herpetosiphon gulosus]|uniref:RNA polymerase sigma factor n=1 Tax=Herpetosiphon gulosus TaxID=1973496 RepID=A0ABP9WV46_9CHLR